MCSVTNLGILSIYLSIFEHFVMSVNGGVSTLMSTSEAVRPTVPAGVAVVSPPGPPIHQVWSHHGWRWVMMMVMMGWE